MAKSLRSLALLFCLFWYCTLQFPVAVHAQSRVTAASSNLPSDSTVAKGEEDSDEEANGKLFVSIRVDESGTTTANSNLMVSKEIPNASSNMKAALQAALSCQLVDESRFKNSSMTHLSFYSGSCTPSYSGSRFSHEGELLTAPLLSFCRENSIEQLDVDFLLPPSSAAETRPLPAKDHSFPGQPAFAGRFPASYSYAWDVKKNLPSQISFRFGYSPSQIKRGALCLFLLLLAPLGLLSWLGRRALSADISDKPVVWFSYMRALSWILNGTLFFWWAALDYFNVEPILRFLAAGTSISSFIDHPAAMQIVGWVPPSVVWLLCYRLSHPVQEKLRGLHWTKRELTLQALYSLLAGLFPLAMFLTGLSMLSRPGPAAPLWFVGAILVRVVAAQALLKLTGMQPHALTSGDLRDRAFAIAGHVGVKLQQVYLIPSGKGQMANAFASTGNNISFTDFLLQRINPREVDYVIAHELTHLKLKHPFKLGMARLGGFFLGMFLMTLLAFVPAANFPLGRYLFLFAFMTAFPFFISRRFEYVADAGAVATTGDPRAAISGLFKLSSLNMHPLQWSKWSEKWLSHPSSLRRAQAIAKKAGIPFEEIPAIAREGASDASTYAGKSISAPSDKLYSTQHKKASVLRLSFILLGILSFIPSFFALAAQHLPSGHPSLQLTLFVLSIPVTFAAILIFSNYVPRLTRGSLAARLNQKLAAQGVQVAQWGGICVGYSPSSAPRTYEANSFWDIGYLFFRSVRICYWGEEVQFSLRRDQITEIKVDIGTPGFLGVKRVYIAWRDNELQTCGVFNLGRGHADSVRSGTRQTKELADHLCSWWKTPSAARPVPAPLDTLSSPVAREVTCAVPGTMWKPGKLFSELLATAWISSLAAMLCGLPFHMMQYLAGHSYSRLGIPPPYHSPGAGWFVVLAAPLVRFLSLIPTLLYRDKPILIAQLPATSASMSSLSCGSAPAAPTSRDPVSVA